MFFYSQFHAHTYTNTQHLKQAPAHTHLVAGASGDAFAVVVVCYVVNARLVVGRYLVCGAQRGHG